ncbi:uncharacterized protein RCC_03001 [Ramularia collo-cygni]|uniref:Uncharacterized protein n=1 Tax=Ramularia collo-cygni TaxID=112498 RepID=A0A2D3V6Q5_9PEZI|nr:uncharacterized protein RCC_03001 [Ramularia collo-cygni]CZT17169.1 uncharacterized protein RCC_03001 [Ramularia collo-cygni]
MLSTKAVGDLLSHNRDERLCRRWYLITPNGTLLAYSQPTNINDLRKQAAIAAICWQQHESRGSAGRLTGEYDEEIAEDAEQNPLHVLTIESEDANVIMRRVQEHLLLVLEGGVPPRRNGFERRITAEGVDGSQLRSHQGDGHTDVANPVKAEHDGSSVAANVLRLQRTKMDALAAILRADFEQTGFKMPDVGGATVF